MQVLLWIMGCVLVVGSSCQKPIREGKIPFALSLAFEKIPLIAGDDEAKDRIALQLAHQAAEYDDYKSVLKVIEGIGEARRGLAYAVAAWDSASHGYYRYASEFIKLSDSDKWIHPDAEKGVQNAYLSGAERLLGEENLSRKRISSILDPRSKQFAESLVRALAIAREPKKTTALGENISAEGVESTVQTLLYGFKKPKETREDRVAIYHLLEQVISATDPQTAAGCWSRLAVAAQDCGLKGEAALAAQKSRELALSLNPQAEGYAIGLRDAAFAMLATGDRQEALHCLEVASVKPELVAYYYQPQAMTAIAEGYEKLGEKEKANSWWLKAVKTAKGHHHPRARQINVVLLLSSMGRAGVVPSPEVMEVIEAIGRGEGGDAPLPPGFVKMGDINTNAVTAPSKQDKKETKEKKDKNKNKNKKESKVPAG
jgi:tetratricopeptide (TPR) repeat protein